MKKNVWVIIIVVIFVSLLFYFLSDDFRMLFTPDGGPSDRPAENAAIVE